MASQKRVDGKTPNGGVYSVAYFLNDEGESVDEKEATRVEIKEFDAKDNEIHRTYGTIGKKNG